MTSILFSLRLLFVVIRSSLKIFNRIDINNQLLRLPPPISLRNNACYAIVQMGRLALGVASVPHLADDRLLRDNCPDVSIYFAQMSIIMEAQTRTKYQDTITALAEVAGCCHHDAPDGRPHIRAFPCEDVYPSMPMVAPRMPE